jgi:hypothetical protein
MQFEQIECHLHIVEPHGDVFHVDVFSDVVKVFDEMRELVLD